MKNFAEVNKEFTRTVAAFIVEGYAINTGTMAGSQGEIARVDLTRSGELLRVLLEKTFEHGKTPDGRRYYLNAVKLTVGRCTEPMEVNSPSTWYTVWNNKLEILREQVWYEAETPDGNRYCDLGEALEWFDKMYGKEGER